MTSTSESATGSSPVSDLSFMMTVPAVPSTQSPMVLRTPVKPTGPDDGTSLMPFVPGILSGPKGGGLVEAKAYVSPFAGIRTQTFLPFGPKEGGGALVGAAPPKSFPLPPPMSMRSVPMLSPPPPPPHAPALPPPVEPVVKPKADTIGATQRRFREKVKASIGKKKSSEEARLGASQARIQQLTQKNAEAEKLIAEQKDTLQRTLAD